MMRIMLWAFGIGIALGGCSRSIDPPTFDGQRAFGYLRDQVAFGPRVPGTNAWADCRQYCYDHFRACGFEIDSLSFAFRDPYSGRDVPLVNVIARHRSSPHNDKALLLMAHYDSRPRTDYHSDSTRRAEPISGANDGASGVAVLLELAHLVAERAPGCNFDIVLSDGEDWGESGDRQYYLLGSRELARRGLRDRYRFGIVVDMVGDKVQQICREEYSEKYFKPINDLIWGVAARLKVATFIDTVRHTVMDDHLEVAAGGLPTAVVIDFDFPYWHTENDTPDKCSAESLANVGRVLTYIVYNESLWPEK